MHAATSLQKAIKIVLVPLSSQKCFNEKVPSFNPFRVSRKLFTLFITPPRILLHFVSMHPSIVVSPPPPSVVHYNLIRIISAITRQIANKQGNKLEKMHFWEYTFNALFMKYHNDNTNTIIWQNIRGMKNGSARIIYQKWEYLWLWCVCSCILKK